MSMSNVDINSKISIKIKVNKIYNRLKTKCDTFMLYVIKNENRKAIQQ